MPRDGGYTRVVRTESKNVYDQGESAILEFVDGPKDTRFMMAAKTVAFDRVSGRDHTPVTLINVKKVTQFRGEEAFEAMVQKFVALRTGGSMAVAEEDLEDEEETSAEREAASLADRSQARAQHMGDAIVPESVKQSALDQKKSQ